ncbi:MAG: sucrase ferredoxin [Acidimicrobiales bacterium]
MGEAAPLRCSAWARSERADPIGTAGHYDGFLLVEHPLPWPRDVGELPALAPIAALLAEARIRLQTLVPAGNRALRATWYRRGDQRWYSGYRRGDAGPTARLATTAASALAAPVPLGPPSRAADTLARDVLVCTHGRRDVCCGSLGVGLALELSAGNALGADVAIRRTSHTGGHRFAPTVIVLPEGTVWAHVDAEVLAGIVKRSGDPAKLGDHYRGCTGLGPPAVQALEREVLRRVGWDLLERPRRGEDLGSGRTRLSVATAGLGAGNAAAQVWEAYVEPGRTLPVPECGQPLAAAKKTETELVVRRLAQVEGPLVA